MKLNKIELLLGSLLSMIGCSDGKTMPEGQLVSLQYSTNACMAENEYEGSLERDSTGSFVVRSMLEYYGPMYEKRIDSAAVEHFKEIIKEEKMYLYKSSYQPSMEVLDGWGWSFRAKFSDGKSIISGGSNASPKGNGLSRICAYMQELAKDGTLVENTDSLSEE